MFIGLAMLRGWAGSAKLALGAFLGIAKEMESSSMDKMRAAVSPRILGDLNF